DELKLSYRTSVYKDSDKIICRAYMKLKKGDPDEIRAKMDDFMNRRKDKQPLDYPSAGSTFKRPEGYFAGKLIEDCGLKGAFVGDAQVSEKHCGFIINKGNATSTDIIKLIALVQDFVLAKTGVFLETEVKIV
ncbi:MAG: UDP-N-acetylmuramate dehydrogenase, partial [Clostridia bacterium]|nr:UDP-N-acetylmuramate dehydrogenase [Clostridia bacterium]